MQAALHVDAVYASLTIGLDDPAVPTASTAAVVAALLHRGLLFRFRSSVTSDAEEKVPTGRRADSH
jgi:hypothetical protein